jgi:hypothetical protein
MMSGSKKLRSPTCAQTIDGPNIIISDATLSIANMTSEDGEALRRAVADMFRPLSIPTLQSNELHLVTKQESEKKCQDH